MRNGNTNDFQIVDVASYGIKAEVVDDGHIYTSYVDFARASGHIGATNPLGTSPSPVGGDKVTVLAFGRHGNRDDTVFVIQTDRGSKHMIGRDGLEFLPKEVPSIAYDFSNYFYSDIPETILTREAVVNKAKADVEAIEADGMKVHSAKYDASQGNFTYTHYVYYVKYVVNREKRTVVALVHGKNSGKLYHKGIAKCDPDDVFNEHIGKAIAVRRAFELPVPDEYTKAPQPTEVRAGMVVKFGSHIVKVMPSDKAWIYDYTRGTCSENSYAANNGKIIDDSDVY